MKPPSFNPEWPEDVQALYRHDMQEMWDPAIAPHVWNQYHNQLDIYLSLAERKGQLAILDVGCAQGTLALLLAERGHRVWAMDIRRQFLDYAASRYEKGAIQFVCGNALEIELEERFDLIYANQVVEHLVFPFEFLQRLVTWLKPVGRLVLSTPNADYVKNSLPTFSELGDLSRYEHLQHTADADGHFYAYTGKELQAIFNQADLNDVKISYFETLWISGHMKVRYLHGILPWNILSTCDHFTLSIPIIGKMFAHQLLALGSLP